MTTPIADFISQYADSDFSRLHMPGHKGVAISGPEKYDITEIYGADELYEADGIINMSEDNATSLFGTAHTFYSTEGSSLVIKAMLMTALQNSCGHGEKYILAARNIHKTFIYGCALLGIESEWIYPDNPEQLCSCLISADTLRNSFEQCFSKHKRLPFAVYITSPDYLGNLQDISSLSAVCKKYRVPLLVDNAHGAYLKFLSSSLHPVDLGADMCCDSAHKTLPALTGGAYLHVSRFAPYAFLQSARNSLSIFASTSPSYLILNSLDTVNKYLTDDYSDKLMCCIEEVQNLRSYLRGRGWYVTDSEPLKLVLDCRSMSIDGREVMSLLRQNMIECEYGSSEHVVMMFTPENRMEDYKRIRKALEYVPDGIGFDFPAYTLSKGEKVMSLRDAILSPYEELNVENSVGRVCAVPTVSCPPAIPIVISGERITAESINLFKLYGISNVKVVKEDI